MSIEEGFANLNKSASAPALSGPLTVGGTNAIGQYAYCSLYQNNQIPNNVAVTLSDYGSLGAENGASDTLGPVIFDGGLIMATTGTFTLAGDVTNHFSTNPVTGLYGDVFLSGNRTFYCDAASSLLVQSPLGGSGGIVKKGPGEILLLNACTYDGYTSVQEGTLKLESNGRPGGPGSGTEIYPDGVLYLNGVNVTNEYLTLHGGGSDSGVALIYHNTNSWVGGTVELQDAPNFKAEPTAKITFTGQFTGSTSFSHDGNGTFVLGGTAANDYTGGTTFRGGVLQLSKSGATAIPHSLTVGYSTNSASVKCLAANQFGALLGSELGLGGVTLNASSSLDCGGFNQTVANLYLTDATVATGAGVLSLPGNLIVQSAASGQSFLTGNIQLITGISSGHVFNVYGNAVVFSSITFTESGTQNIYKDGTGQFGSLGALLFDGKLTVHQGRWLAANMNPFGSTVGPTVVDAGATLVTFAGPFDESIQLSGSGDNGAGALYSAATNTFYGTITLNADATIYADTNAILGIFGPVTGSGVLTKEGSGILRFTGLQANTYVGDTIISHGTLELTKSGAIAVPGNITCLGNNGNNGVRLLLADQIADTSAVVLNGSDSLDLNNHNETIGSLAGSGPVPLGNATLSVGGNNTDTSFSGGMGGTGGLTKIGTGTMTLSGAKIYTGTTTVLAGKLLVNGQQPQSPVSINGGTLGGTGKVGNISDSSGYVSPGASPGILICSNYSTFNTSNQLQIEINGSTPGTGYDQLQVNGSVLLMGGTLQVTMNMVGAISNQYVIVANDGVDLVNGTFTGLPEGGSITNHGAVFTITYHGGDGNDIVLTQQSLGLISQLTTGQKLPNGRFAIIGQGAANLTYSVEACTNLAPPVAWVKIGTAVADGNGKVSFSDVGAPLYPIRFYRLHYP
jgi:autotransporter-associated beta strand protein